MHTDVYQGKSIIEFYHMTPHFASFWRCDFALWSDVPGLRTRFLNTLRFRGIIALKRMRLAEYCGK